MARLRGPAGSLSTCAFLLLLLAFRIEAQNNNNNNNNNQQSSASSAASSVKASSAVLSNLPNLSAATSTEASSTSAKSSSASQTAATVSVTNAPALTTGSVFHLTGLPTLAGAGIPTVIVPNTQNAPYMQKSSLPEGTVFIAVGAALGFLGAAILAWRGLVAWSLHRSVKRAAMNQGHMDNKNLLRGGPSKGIYSHVGASSTLSLDHLNSPNPARNSKYHSNVPPTPKHGAQPSASNLFFSPTAGAGLHSSANRSSSYLPAGYYAPGSSAPAAGAQTTHIGSRPYSSGPNAGGYTRARSVGPSPPSSPGLPPTSRGNESNFTSDYARSSVAGNIGGTGLYNQQQSVSSLNLTAAPLHQGRAPSAYLEDLFENHGNGPRERF